MKKHLICLTTATAALLLAFGACGGGGTAIAVTGVSLDKTEITLQVGARETLVQTVSPSNAANKTVTWSSDNTGVATVSGGVVTAVWYGSAAITVTTQDGGKMAACLVTVPDIAVTGVSLDKTEITLQVGAQETLAQTVSPSNATNKTVTWSSDDTGVATVSGGVVTAVWYGSAAITVTTQDGGKTATCIVTVPDPKDDDTYDTPFALRDALLSFANEIQGRNLTEAQQATYSDRLEQIYADAFSRDTYAKHLPYASSHLREMFAKSTDFKFPYNYLANYGRNEISVGTLLEVSGIQHNILHETGHALGLGEDLAELFAHKNMGRDMSDPFVQNADNFFYTPFYANLLLEKVGDDAFWRKVYEGSNEKYGEMWNANMTVTGDDDTRQPLVSFATLSLTKWLGAMARNRQGYTEYQKIVTDFENFVGVKDVEQRFASIAPLFESALKDNKAAEAEVKQFFGAVERFNEIYQGILPKSYSNIDEGAGPIWSHFKITPTTKSQPITTTHKPKRNI